MSKKRKSYPALCAWCKKVALIGGKQVPLKETGMKVSEFESHGICKPCADKMRAEYKQAQKTENPPVFVVDKPTWKKARQLVDPSYKGRKKPGVYYAVVTDVYKKLGGRIKRLARGNPSSKEWDAVIDMFRKFHDFLPSGVDPVEVETRTIPKILAALGRLEAVVYRSDKWGRPMTSYIHKFKAKDRPLLCTNADGTQLYIVGGSYKIEADGITG